MQRKSVLAAAVIGVGAWSLATQAATLSVSIETVATGLNDQIISYADVDSNGKLGVMVASEINVANATFYRRNGAASYSAPQTFDTSNLSGTNSMELSDFTFVGTTPWISFTRPNSTVKNLAVSSTAAGSSRLVSAANSHRGSSIVGVGTNTLYVASYKGSNGTTTSPAATVYKSTDADTTVTFGAGTNVAPSSSTSDMAYFRSIDLKTDSNGVYATYYHKTAGNTLGAGIVAESSGTFTNGVWVDRGDITNGGSGHRTRGFDAVRIGTTSYIGIIAYSSKNDSAGTGNGARLWVGKYAAGDTIDADGAIQAPNLTRLSFGTWNLTSTVDQGGNVSMAALGNVPYLAYRDQIDSTIWLTYLDNGTWVTPTQVSTDATQSGFELIALDSGNLALSYMHNVGTGNVDVAKVAIISVPEPASLALLGGPLLGLTMRRRKWT